MLEDPATCVHPCGQLLKCQHPCTRPCGSCIGSSIDSQSITRPFLRSVTPELLEQYEAYVRKEKDALDDLQEGSQSRRHWRGFMDSEVARGQALASQWMAWVRGEGRKAVQHAGPCSKECGRSLQCGHQCKLACHQGKGCGGCKARCWIRCRHRICKEACKEPCVPCAGSCGWRCRHQGECSMPCSAPCDRCGT